MITFIFIIAIIILLLGISKLYLKDEVLTIFLMSLIGVCILSIISINTKQSKTKLFKPEYQIELLNQNDVRIYNGKTYKTIQFDSIQDYIINDNE